MKERNMAVLVQVYTMGEGHSVHGVYNGVREARRYAKRLREENLYYYDGVSVERWVGSKHTTLEAWNRFRKGDGSGHDGWVQNDAVSVAMLNGTISTSEYLQLKRAKRKATA